MKFEINLVTNDLSQYPHSQMNILVAIFISNHRTKPTFELWREINESNDSQYSKTSKIQIQTSIIRNTP